jgi:hypothetical protein
MNEKPDKVVRITMQDGLPVPDQDPIQVKKDQQKIRFCADFQFEITIPGYTDIKYSSGGSDCRFSAKTGFFGEIKQYKYSITANRVVNDPIIDIQP